MIQAPSLKKFMSPTSEEVDVKGRFLGRRYLAAGSEEVPQYRWPLAAGSW